MLNFHFTCLWALMKGGLEISENKPDKSCYLNIFEPNYFYKSAKQVYNLWISILLKKYLVCFLLIL